MTNPFKGKQVDQLPPKKPEYKQREWLTWPAVPARDDRPKVSQSRRAYDPRSNRGSITIDNLTEKELDAIESMLKGHSYTTCLNGRVHAWHVNEALPEVQPDLQMQEFWSEEAQVGAVLHLPEADKKGLRSPCLLIRGLGAGIIDESGQRKGRRRKNLELTESCGFVCYRSRRNVKGEYQELWYLPALSCAKGPLKKFVEQTKAEHKDIKWYTLVELAADYIASDLSLSFGSLEVCTQRWALCVD